LKGILIVVAVAFVGLFAFVVIIAAVLRSSAASPEPATSVEPVCSWNVFGARMWIVVLRRCPTALAAAVTRSVVRFHLRDLDLVLELEGALVIVHPDLRPLDGRRPELGDLRLESPDASRLREVLRGDRQSVSPLR
jgi:hypothetical protein